MALVAFWIDLAENAKHQYLRLDVKFWHTTKSLATSNSVRLKDLFELVNGDSYTEYYSQQKTSIPYIRIADLSFKFGISDDNLVYLDDSVSLKDEKMLREDDLILATIGSVGKISLARDFRGGTFSNNTTLLRVRDKSNHNPAFYEKLFQTNLFQRYIAGVVSQKAQPNLQTYDLENIKVPLFSKPKQDALVAQVAPIETNIKQLKAQIASPQAVISKVFADAFEFDLEKFERAKKQTFFEADFTMIANDRHLKASFTTLKSAMEQDTLKLDVPYLKIENLAEDIVVGGDKPSVFSEYETDACKYPVYSNGKEKDGLFGFTNEYRVKSPCVTISARGTVGFSVARDELFFPIVRLITVITDSKKVLNQYLEHALNFINIQQSGNTIAQLTAPMVKEIEVPVPDLQTQQGIVDEIKAELDKQEALKQQIQIERDKIDRIIEAAIHK